MAHSLIFELLTSSMAFSLRKEGGKERGKDRSTMRTEERTRGKHVGREKVRSTLK